MILYHTIYFSRVEQVVVAEQSEDIESVAAILDDNFGFFHLTDSPTRALGLKLFSLAQCKLREPIGIQAIERSYSKE